jgi:hypothetical protein
VSYPAARSHFASPPSIASQRNLTLGPRRAEAPYSPAIRSVLERLHLGEGDVFGSHENELGDPHAPLDAERLPSWFMRGTRISPR